MWIDVQLIKQESHEYQNQISVVIYQCSDIRKL
jgi:hypothetical protein